MAEYDLGTARGRIEIDSSGAEAGAARAGSAVKGLDRDMEKAGRTLTSTGVVMGGIGVAAVAGFGVAVNAAANFEQRISAIGAVSNASKEDLDQFRQLALKLGADTKFSATEAASAIEELAKAGVPLPDIMKGAAKAVTDLAAAGEVDLVRAAEITSNAMNAFGISGEEASRVADVFATAANASAADVDILGQSLAQVSAVAAVVGLSFEDTISALELFANKGLKGSDAGTSLKTMLLNLQPATLKQQELFDELGITVDGAGNKFFDAQGKLKDLGAIQEILQQSTEGMTQAQRLATFEMIGGSDAIRAFSILAGDTSGQLQGLRDGLDRQGSASETAKARMDNLKGSIEQMKGSIETVMIRIGQMGQGPIRSLVDWITRLVNGFMNLSPGMQQIIIMGTLITGVLIGLAGVFLLVGGGILKLISTFKELRAAFQVIKQMQLMTKAMTALNASFLTNPVFLIIAGLVALGVALYVLYQRSEAFRNVIDSLWQAAQKAFDYILNAGMAVVNFFRNNWLTILTIVAPFIGLPIIIIRNWSTIVSFFSELPGKIISFLAMILTAAVSWGVNMIANVVGFLARMVAAFPEALAFVIGYVIGWHVRMLVAFVQLGIDIITAVVGFLTRLPGYFVDFFTWAITNTISWVSDMIGKAVDLGARFLNAIVEFFSQLPGRIWDFLTSAATNTANWVVDMAGKAVDLGSRFLNTIVEWFQQLPGRIAEFFGNMVQEATTWASTMWDRAREMASNVYNGVRDGLEGLPGLVGRILGRVIDAIKGAIRSAFNAVKDFAAAMWDGFKKGLGIGSPSLIEYAMWDMVDNVTDSTKDLQGQLLRVQKIAKSNFGEFGPTINGQMDQARATYGSAMAQTRAAVGDAMSQANGAMAAAGVTFQNTFNTNADPFQISDQMVWDMRVHVR